MSEEAGIYDVQSTTGTMTSPEPPWIWIKVPKCTLVFSRREVKRAIQRGRVFGRHATTAQRLADAREDG